MAASGKKRSLSAKLSELVGESAAKKRTKNCGIEIKQLGLEQEDVLVKNREINCLKNDFFNIDTISLSRALLGKYLLRLIRENDSPGRLLVGKIVECEAYPGGNDRASHSYGGKMTERIKAMYMKAGTCYVYNIYGMYCCMNVSSCEAGGAVLIRALEPVSGTEIMQLNRTIKSKKKVIPIQELTSGPSKLCMALKIDKASFNQVNMCDSELIWILDQIETSESRVDENIIATRRIGINYAGDKAINALYRFCLKNNPFVSVKITNE